MNSGNSSMVNLCRNEQSGDFFWTTNVIYITFLFIPKALGSICSQCFFQTRTQAVFRKALIFIDLTGRYCFLIFRYFRSCRLEDCRCPCYNYFGLAIGWLMVVGATAYGVDLEKARLTPEGTIESDRLIVTLELAGSGDAAALNYTLSYDPEKMEPVEVIPGSSVIAGEKNFADNVVAPGLWTMVVMGLNQRAIPDGNIAVAKFRLRTPQPEALEVTVEEPVLSTWDGEEIPVTGGRFEILVKRDDVKQPDESSSTETATGTATGTKTPNLVGVSAGNRPGAGIYLSQPERGISDGNRKHSVTRQAVQQQNNPTAEIAAAHGSVAERDAETNDVIPNRRFGVKFSGRVVVGFNQTPESIDSSLTVEDEGLREAGKVILSSDNRSQGERVSDIWIWGVATGAGLVGVGMLAIRLRSVRRRR